MSRDEFVWVEKYRPKTIDECILPDNIKNTFKAFLDKGEVPNLLLSGPPGCGKTTVAKALCNDCLLYTSPSPRDLSTSRMPSSA